LAGRESKSSTKTRTDVSGSTSVTERVRGETWSERGANGGGNGFGRAQVGLADAGKKRAGGSGTKAYTGGCPGAGIARPARPRA
jgi:hypothetical protein